MSEEGFARPAFGRVHGRRRGRKLRLGQQALLDTLLPQISLTPEQIDQTDPRSLFIPPVREIWLEIGFGGGEHLAYQAKNNPDIGLIGCEVFQTGIVGLLSAIDAEAIGNIRVVVDDARLVLAALPDASIQHAFVLFPDPWPKPRHHKRRMISPATMAALSRVLADGAELRLGTDIPDYLRVMLSLAGDHPDFDWLARRPADWQHRPADWPQTRYEAKALAAGRTPSFLRFVRRTRVKT